ncbi:MAG: hypothetical protein LBQ22_06725 [Bacteroidales bacterium]|jgi:hypothetical protein|nr:hypothetical protein [Bacteroidales bacterium]
MIIRRNIVVVLSGLMLFAAGCKKDSPAVLTTQAFEIKSTSVKTGGNITDDGDASITERGVCWGLYKDPTIFDNKIVEGSGTGSFEITINGLEPDKLYFVRAYATNKIGTSYGNNVFFTTNQIPDVITGDVLYIGATYAKCSGTVINDGGFTVIEKGICWSSEINPTIADDKVAIGQGAGTFVCDINGLEEITAYYVRAYATTENGTGYGNILSITTEEIKSAKVIINSVRNGLIPEVNSSVIDDGGASILEKGVIWSKTSSGVTLENADGRKEAGSGSEDFSVSLSGLDVYEMYYVRAYARNKKGISYSTVSSVYTFDF